MRSPKSLLGRSRLASRIRLSLGFYRVCPGQRQQRAARSGHQGAWVDDNVVVML